jgi:hypothetical protein
LKADQAQSLIVSSAPCFSDKEKDEASLLICFQGNSSDAFILRFAGV